MSHKLIHYLRNERRREGLTQGDVASLLGGRWKGRVAWYEHGAIPPINVALEYEAILGRPVSELLGGAYQRAVLNVQQRARDLLAKDHVPNTPREWRRHNTLERIAA